VGKSVVFRALLATCLTVSVAVTAWTAAAGAAGLDRATIRGARAHCLRRPSILLSSPPVAGPFESSDGLVPPPGAGYVTGSWGGWLANSSSQTYVATEMDLTEPSVTSYCSGYNSEAQWTGLGGFNSKQLVQDGVEVPSSYTSLCSSKSSGYCAWYEYLNSSNSNPPHILSKVDVNAGDSIHLYTSYSTSNGEIDFYVADNTTGTGQSLLITGVGSSYDDGSTGDFIGAERLAGNGLKHFSQFDTSNGYAENKSGSWTTISSAQYPTKATLTNGSDTLAITGGLNSSGTGFSMTWNACN